MTNVNFLPNTSQRKEGINIKSFNRYGMDQSGEILYEYNSLGYRGQEYDPDAKFVMYAAGCSHTHGTGLMWEDTFAYQFKKLYAERFGLDTQEVSLMNFSVGAASNSYMVRTLITNCNAKKPDFLLCNFTHKKNLEFKDIAANEPFCPSIPKSEPAATILDLPYMNDLNLFVETVKNMLLLQYYCKANNIDYVFAWTDYPDFPEYFERVRDTHRFLEEELDLDFFLQKSIRQVKVDFAADKAEHDTKAHGGPLTNALYAKMLFAKYLELYH